MSATASSNKAHKSFYMPLATKLPKLKTTKSITPSVTSLLVLFNLPLTPSGLSWFREAVLSCIESDSEREIWSNEAIGKEGEKVYRSGYPLIQFRCHQKMAAIFALQAGVPLVEKFVQQYANHPQKNNNDFSWQGRPYPLQHTLLEKENNFAIKTFTAKLRPQPVVYRLHTWLPLNKENYAWWKANRNLPDTTKTKRLEQLLVNHLAAVITATGGYIPKQRIKLIILDKDRLKQVNFKDTGQVAFDIRYTVNLQLPQYIGLGNHPAFGFGWQRLEKE
jgi:hypothetical protein